MRQSSTAARQDYEVHQEFGISAKITGVPQSQSKRAEEIIIGAVLYVALPLFSLWLTEGTALYLTNGEPFYKEYLNSMSIPTYSDTKTRNPIVFANCGGYNFAHTYIEYLDKTYGWDKVCELLVSEDYEDIFNKSQKDIYDEWVAYIILIYS